MTFFANAEQRRAKRDLVGVVTRYVEGFNGGIVKVTYNQGSDIVIVTLNKPSFDYRGTENMKESRDNVIKALETAGTIRFDKDSATGGVDQASFHIHLSQNGGISELTQKFGALWLEQDAAKEQEPHCSHCATVDASRAGTGRGR